MAITIIPAADNSGATAGWEMLARTVQLNQARKRQTEANYQDLIMKLSDPNVTEEQQNAILTSDPVQFKASYGVDISQVGTDIAQFRKAADVVAPNGMAMNGAAPTGETKRVLVPHPGGTAQQQQQAATLENTQVNTEADRARMKLNESQAALASKDMQLNVGNATANVKAKMRTADGRVPTFNEVQGYYEGKVELTPLKPEQDRREQIAFLLGQDPNDPVGKVMLHAFDNETDKSDLDIETMAANKRNIIADARLKEQEWELINAGRNPRTGQPMGAADAIEPNKLMALGKGFNDAIEHALAPFGMPSRTTSAAPPRVPFTDTTLVGPFGMSMPMALWSKSAGDNPKIASAIFGNGMADPVSVRRDLLAAVPAGQKLQSVDFPTFDQKTGQSSTTTFKVDDLVPRVVQMRRALATEMPALFTAMRQASPATLIYMSAGNPLILQAARAYAPDVYKMITDARAADAVASATAPPPSENDPARIDPHTAPMVNDVRRLQQQVDDLNKMLKGATATPGEQ